MKEEIVIYKDKKEEIDKKVLEKLKEGKNKKDIIAILNISEETLNASILELIRQGIINGGDIERFKHKARIGEKKEKLLKYLNEGMSKEEAGRKVHMGNADAYKLVEELVKEGKIEERYLYYGNGLREKNKLEVLKKLEEGYTIIETAGMLEINKNVVYGYVRELVADGKIKRENITKKIRGKVVKKDNHKESDDEEIEKTASAELKQETSKTSMKNKPKNKFENVTEKESENQVKNEDKRVDEMNIETKVKENGELSEDEMEAIAIELLQSGLKKKEIVKKLKIDFKKLRKIIDRALIAGKIQPPPRKEQHRFKGDKVPEVSDIEKWQNAMQNIAKRMQTLPINRVDQRLYFMYCRKIVESGAELSNEEIKTLKKAVIYGEESAGIEKIKFIGMEYLKAGNITPAIDMINEWMQLHGDNEDYEKALNVFKMLKDKQESYEKSCKENLSADKTNENKEQSKLEEVYEVEI